MFKFKQKISPSTNANRHFLVRRTDAKVKGEISTSSSVIENLLMVEFPELLTGDQFKAHAGKRLKTTQQFGALVIRIDDLILQAEKSLPDDWPQTVLATAKTIDTICRRENGMWGQIEMGVFGCFFSGKTESACDDIGKRIQKELAEKVKNTVSVGVAVYPTKSFQESEVLENARKALDHAAFFGPNSIVPFDSVSLNISGDQLYQAGNTHGAIEEFEKALLLDPLNINVLNSLGVCYGETEKLSQAAASFEKVVAIAPEEVMAVYNAGLAYRLMGDKEKALDYFIRANDIEPDVFEVVFETGKIYLENRNYEKAEMIFQKAWALRPESGTVLRHLGECYTGANQLDKAVHIYKKAIKLNPHDAASLSTLGYLFDLKDENPEIALMFSQKSVEFVPENGLFRNRLGCLYLKNDRLDEALKEFEAAQKLGYDSSDLIRQTKHLKN
jgi:tetratricopeptide (TPR) repeat protein